MQRRPMQGPLQKSELLPVPPRRPGPRIAKIRSTSSKRLLVLSEHGRSDPIPAEAFDTFAAGGRHLPSVVDRSINRACELERVGRHEEPVPPGLENLGQAA